MDVSPYKSVVLDQKQILAARDAARDQVRAAAIAEGVDLADEDLYVGLDPPEARVAQQYLHPNMAMARFDQNIPAAANPVLPVPHHGGQAKPDPRLYREHF